MDKDSFSHDQDLIDILKGAESKKAEYPHDLLAARRKLFLEQVEKQTLPPPASDLTETDPDLVRLFGRLKAIEPEYPLQLLARRRSLYGGQIAGTAQGSLWNVLRFSFKNIFAGWATSQRSTSTKFARASALALGLAMFAFAAFALYGGILRSPVSLLSPNEILPVVPGTATSTSQAQAVIICRDGYEPPLCLTTEFDNSHDLSYAGNGKARPAVAKDTYTGYGKIHHAAHLNDGLYGPGASWVSNSPNSWIKIDLGTTTDVNTIAFGRDRLGTLNDGDPGRFVIAVATWDDVYADGNSSNDEREYVEVYDSERAGFDGKISGSETVVALFEVKQARFIKITFENARTAVDEVEAFVSDPSVVTIEPTKTASREETRPGASTPVVLNTPLPTDTATAVPIDTLSPTETAITIPTDTATPVGTPTPIDTPTPVDTPIPTDPVIPSIPAPIDTLVPFPASPPIILPTYVPVPTEHLDGPFMDDLQ